MLPDNKKIIVFSDTHLTERFEQAKFNLLFRIIHQADQVIINGDFWDGRIIPFNTFFHSAWKALFPLLLEKEAVYIYGNHDREIDADNRVQFFSKYQTNYHVVSSGARTFHFIHGHTLNSNMSQWGERLPRPMAKPFIRVHAFLENSMGRRFQTTKSWIYPFQRWDTRRQERYASLAMKDGHVLVCGHTHLPVCELAQKFINTGEIYAHRASYVILSQARVEVVQERY